jgi:hypothetical protein
LGLACYIGWVGGWVSLFICLVALRFDTTWVWRGFFSSSAVIVLMFFRS